MSAWAAVRYSRRQGLAGTVYEKPILCEGPAGAWKTELAKGIPGPTAGAVVARTRD